MASSADSHDLTELTPVKLVDDDGEETDVKVPCDTGRYITSCKRP